MKWNVYVYTDVLKQLNSGYALFMWCFFIIRFKILSIINSDIKIYEVIISGHNTYGLAKINTEFSFWIRSGQKVKPFC